MNKAYKIFGGFLSLLVVGGLSAHTGRMGSQMFTNDSVSSDAPQGSVIDEWSWVVGA